MDKRDVLAMLRAAKSAHIQWRARAQALVAGIPLEKEQVPVAYTDCKFGKWFYGMGQELSRLETYRGIEEPHQQLHLIYMQIFKHLFGDDDRSAFGKLFGSKKKHRAAQMEQARALLPQLINVSETLLKAVDILEHDVRSMSDDEFVRIAGGDYLGRVADGRNVFAGHAH